MTLSQPNVEFTDTIFRQVNSEVETAVPVFIGFTEIGEVNKLYPINSVAQYEQELGSSIERAKISLNAESAIYQSTLYYTIKHYFDNGGTFCFVVSLGHYKTNDKITADQFINLLLAEELKQLLAGEMSITLVSVPDLSLLDTWYPSWSVAGYTGAEKWQQVWQAITKLCIARRGLFGLLDSPLDALLTRKVTDIFVQNNTNEQRRWVAAYWPRLVTDYEVTDSLENNNRQLKIIPPSASIAALMQLVDRESGIWKAPANVVLSHVIKPNNSYLEAKDLFSEQGCSVNLIRSFPGRGVRVWGCRTLADGTESLWRYIQVRRCVSYIETSITELGRFVVYEPNNEITWMKLKGQITTWLRDLWLKGGLYGAEEDEAFQVLVGLNETMTENDINAGQLIVHISVAVLYPAEFIKVSLKFESSDSNTRTYPQIRNMSAML